MFNISVAKLVLCQGTWPFLSFLHDPGLISIYRRHIFHKNRHCEKPGAPLACLGISSYIITSRQIQHMCLLKGVHQIGVPFKRSLPSWNTLLLSFCLSFLLHPRSESFCILSPPINLLCEICCVVWFLQHSLAQINPPRYPSASDTLNPIIRFKAHTLLFSRFTASKSVAAI